jgi:hypothetical protein
MSFFNSNKDISTLLLFFSSTFFMAPPVKIVHHCKHNEQPRPNQIASLAPNLAATLRQKTQAAFRVSRLS